MICIIDYGAGNLQSVTNALRKLKCEPVISSERKEILKADKIILPGVGSFGDAMLALRTSGLDETIREAVDGGKPFLGICLGLQLLFESSEESKGVEGLGLLKGKIEKIPHGQQRIEGRKLKIPHVGWNSLDNVKKGTLLEGFEGKYMYFVHSYCLKDADEDICMSYTSHSIRFISAVQKGNLYACQFHPEKSSTEGLKILHKFAAE